MSSAWYYGDELRNPIYIGQAAKTCLFWGFMPSRFFLSSRAGHAGHGTGTAGHGRAWAKGRAGGKILGLHQKNGVVLVGEHGSDVGATVPMAVERRLAYWSAFRDQL